MTRFSLPSQWMILYIVTVSSSVHA